MNSLRARLILGSALIAVVPLAVSMVFLVDRMESTVRAEAGERLSATLGAMTSEIASDERRAFEKLQILARDPELKRLYLVGRPGSRALSDYLAGRRFLLGYDFLRVADTSGVIVADAAHAPAADEATREHSAATAPPVNHPPPRAVRPLRGGGGLAVVASQPIRYQNELAGRIEGGFVLDRAFLDRLAAQSGLGLALRDGQERVAAATIPTASGNRSSPIGRQPELSVPLRIGNPPHASLVGVMSTAAAERTIVSLQIIAGVLGLLALGIAIALGLAWSSQVSKPVEQLAAYSARLARGEWDEPLALRGVRELTTLGTALERMRQDLRSYRDRLVASERQAAWSQMARKVAHEVKNPLTPIAISVSDLKRSYEQKRPDFPEILDQAVRTIGAEVDTLKRLLEEFADFARFPPPRFAACRWSGLAADLETLYGREVAAGLLAVSPEGRSISFDADEGQVRQALVNLVRNGLDAAGDGGRVSVSARSENSSLLLDVSDTGPGLTPEQTARLFAPGFTTKKGGSGLGLTIVERIVLEHGGTITVESAPGSGTRFRIRLPLARKE